MSDEFFGVRALLAQRTRFLCPLLAYQRQRLATATLFRELAMAVKGRFALHVVTESIAMSPRMWLGARYLHLVLLILVLAGVLGLVADERYTTAVVLAIGGAFVLFFLSVRPHEDYVRHVAARLTDLLEQGRTLSEAIHGLPGVFTRQEREVIAIGEQSGHLAESLDAMAEYNILTGQFNRLLAAACYPLFVLGYCVIVASFIWARVMPKYQDIYHQIGYSLPEPTEALVSGAPYPIVLLVALGGLMVVFSLIVLVVFVPRLLGGSMTATLLFFVGFGAIATLVFAAAFAGLFWRTGAGGDVFALGIALGLGAAVSIGAYYLLFWVVTIPPRAARAMAETLLPWLRPMRKLRMARFLLSLGYALRARIPLPEALEMAGCAVRGGLSDEAFRFRMMVEQGQGFTECLKSSRCLDDRTVAILSLADWRGSLADDCVELAESLRIETQRSAERLAALIEWPSIVLVGVIMGGFVLACYMPIFNIPIALLENMP